MSEPLTLTIEREFDAPAELVYRAWTSPREMSMWAHPQGFVAPAAPDEPRTDGAWESVMISPDGQEYRVGGRYLELTPHSRITFTHQWLDEASQPAPETLVEVNLSERNGRTSMTFRQSGFSRETSRDGHRGGWTSSFQNLDALIIRLGGGAHRPKLNLGPVGDARKEPATGGWKLTYVRDFAHPPEVVWDVLTQPDHLLQWAAFTPNRNLGSIGPAILTMSDREPWTNLESEVTLAERPRLLEYSWGPDTLHWELTPTSIGTKLTLQHVTTDLEWVPKIAAGWQLCLDVADRFMSGDPFGPIIGMVAMNHGWPELNDEYANFFDIKESRPAEEVVRERMNQEAQL